MASSGGIGGTLRHLALRARDPKATRQFYVEGLGLRYIGLRRPGSDTFDLTQVAAVDEFSDLVLTDTGTGVEVDYGTGSFELVNVDIATVGASDFIFA